MNMNNSINNSINRHNKRLHTTSLPSRFWLKSMLSFKYISNLSIIITIIAYYMNAYELFFIFSPLIIVNFILISCILCTNLDDFMKTTLETYLPTKTERDNYKIQFILFILLWHLLPIVWLFYILEKENLIKLFRPNFMGIYLKSILIPILYYYYESNEFVYGTINYSLYLIMYIILLLSVCVYLYLE
jgi:hypothetical protein